MGLFAILAGLFCLGAAGVESSKLGELTYSARKEAIDKKRPVYCDARGRHYLTKNGQQVIYMNKEGIKGYYDLSGRFCLYDIIKEYIKEQNEKYSDGKIVLDYVKRYEMLNHSVQYDWSQIILVEKETKRPIVLVIKYANRAGEENKYYLDFLKDEKIGSFFCPVTDERKEITREEYDKYLKMLGNYYNPRLNYRREGI